MMNVDVEVEEIRFNLGQPGHWVAVSIEFRRGMPVEITMRGSDGSVYCSLYCDASSKDAMAVIRRWNRYEKREIRVAQEAVVPFGTGCIGGQE